MPMNSFQRRRWSLKMSGITGVEHGQTVPHEQQDTPEEERRADRRNDREDRISNNAHITTDNLD